MIMSHTPHGTQRTVRALTLLLALGLLPLGLTAVQAQETDAGTAQDAAYQQLRERIESGELSMVDARVIFDAMPPQDWVEKRYAGGVAEIDGAVASERLTADEGEAMKAKMCESLQSMAFYMEVFDISAEQAKKKMAGKANKTERRHKEKREQAEAGRDDWSWMVERLMESGVPRANIEAVLGGIKRIVHGMHEKGEAWKLDARMKEYFTARLDLSGNQIEMAVGLARRASHRASAKPAEEQDPRREANDKLMGAFKRFGINEKTVGWLKKELVSAGLTEQQVKPALGGMVRVIGGIKEQGNAYILNSRVEQYFIENGLTGVQIDKLVELSRTASAKARKVEPDSEAGERTGGDR